MSCFQYIKRWTVSHSLLAKTNVCKLMLDGMSRRRILDLKFVKSKIFNIFFNEVSQYEGYLKLNFRSDQIVSLGS